MTTLCLAVLIYTLSKAGVSPDNIHSITAFLGFISVIADGIIFTSILPSEVVEWII